MEKHGKSNPLKGEILIFRYWHLVNHQVAAKNTKVCASEWGEWCKSFPAKPKA